VSFLSASNVKEFVESPDSNSILMIGRAESKLKRFDLGINVMKFVVEEISNCNMIIISEIDNLKLDFEILQNNKTCSIIEKNLKKTILINNIFSPKRERDSLPFLLNKNNTLDEKK